MKKKKECPFCNKELNGGSRHIYTCKETEEKDKDRRKLSYINHNFPEISDKKKLKGEYEDNLRSLPDLQDEFGIDYKSLLFLLDQYGIRKRGASESAKKISQKKYKKTCLKRYGVDNVSKSEEVKKKKAETFILNYGVDNIWKSDNYWEYVNETLLEKSCITFNDLISDSSKRVWENKSNAEKEIWLKNSIHSKKGKENCIKNRSGYNVSLLERRIEKILNENNIKFETQIKIEDYNCYKFYDFLFCDQNTLLEVNGDYWHANPELYRSKDKINYPFGIRKAKEIWKKDSEKKILAESKGYKVLYLWEKFINESSDQEIINYIKEIIL